MRGVRVDIYWLLVNLFFALSNYIHTTIPPLFTIDQNAQHGKVQSIDFLIPTVSLASFFMHRVVDHLQSFIIRALNYSLVMLR
jgi:hypothetical protein